MTRVVTQLLFVLAAVTLFSACASTRVPVEEAVVGTWSYTVFSTPNGDVTGEFVLNEENGEYTGTISSSATQGTSPIQEFTMMDQQLSFVAAFEADGYPLQAQTRLSFNGSDMIGIMDVSGVGKFQIKATRKS